MREQPDRTVLRLSSAFPEGAEADLDARVTMLNINYGRNRELLDASEPLKEYSQFVAEYRQQRTNGADEDTAVTKAIQVLPEDSKLKKFLEANKAEGTEMSAASGG